MLQTFIGRVAGETLGFDAVGVGDVDGDGATEYLLTSAWSTVNGVRSVEKRCVPRAFVIPEIRVQRQERDFYFSSLVVEQFYEVRTAGARHGRGEFEVQSQQVSGAVARALHRHSCRA